MMIKYRVHDVAKDLDVPNKEVLDILGKYVKEPKKHMTALEENELDIVLTALRRIMPHRTLTRTLQRAMRQRPKRSRPRKQRKSRAKKPLRTRRSRRSRT